tara:strand:+ start:268 stop:807 length:540 start_codon:yes stop_codon:yes gene_type:complete
MIKYLENTLNITEQHQFLFYDNLRYKFTLNFTKGDELGMFASHFITKNEPSTDYIYGTPFNEEEDRLKMISIFYDILKQFDMPKPDFINRLCININYHRTVDVKEHFDFHPKEPRCYSLITYLTTNKGADTTVWDEEGNKHTFEAKRGCSLLISNLEHTFKLPQSGIRSALVGTFRYDN